MKNFRQLFTCSMAMLFSLSAAAQGTQHHDYTETAGGINMKMIYVKGGEFQMGGTPEQGEDADFDEFPVHSVLLSDYCIGMLEVTQGQWEKIMGTTVAQQRDKANPEWALRGEGDDYPMYYVSWDEACAFCRELSRLSGKMYVLPSEAQWEYAARGGRNHDGTKYSGSNDVNAVAWNGPNSGYSSHPAGSKAPNSLGLHDMSGNMWEWCSDLYGPYPATLQINPPGNGQSAQRVLRGGSWPFGIINCRVSIRNSNTPANRASNCGFRVVCIL